MCRKVQGARARAEEEAHLGVAADEGSDGSCRADVAIVGAPALGSLLIHQTLIGCHRRAQRRACEDDGPRTPLDVTRDRYASTFGLGRSGAGKIRDASFR